MSDGCWGSAAGAAVPSRASGSHLSHGYWRVT